MSILVRHGYQNVSTGSGNDPSVSMHDATIRVGGDANLGSVNHDISINSSLMKRPGKYVIIKAFSISNVTLLNVSLTPTSMLGSRAFEIITVKYPDGNSYECLVLSIG